MKYKKFVVYTFPNKNIVLLASLLSDLAIIVVLLVVFAQNLLLAVFAITLLCTLFDGVFWLFFKSKLRKLSIFIAKANDIAKSIKVREDGVVLKNAMPVSKGRFTVYSKFVYYETVGRGSTQTAVEFEPSGEREYLNVLSFFKLENFNFIDKGEQMALELPAWRLEGPELYDGKNYILIIPIEPTSLETTENRITLSHKEDEASFYYKISERLLECGIYYAPSSSSRTTKKARISLLLSEPILVSEELGEVSEPYASKSFTRELLPEIKNPVVLIVYPGALRFGLRLGEWRSFMSKIREALNIPRNINSMTSKRIVLEFALERKFAKDIKHEEEIELKIR